MENKNEEWKIRDGGINHHFPFVYLQSPTIDRYTYSQTWNEAVHKFFFFAKDSPPTVLSLWYLINITYVALSPCSLWSYHRNYQASTYQWRIQLRLSLQSDIVVDQWKLLRSWLMRCVLLLLPLPHVCSVTTNLYVLLHFGVFICFFEFGFGDVIMRLENVLRTRRRLLLRGTLLVAPLLLVSSFLLLVRRNLCLFLALPFRNMLKDCLLILQGYLCTLLNTLYRIFLLK